MMFSFLRTFLPPKRQQPINLVIKEDNYEITPLFSFPPTKQFGVTLQRIWNYNEHEVVPKIVANCVQYLEHHLSTPDLFRVSIHQRRLREIKELADKGFDVKFNGPHEAAIALTTFFRELKQPLIPFTLYRHVLDFGKYNEAQCTRQMVVIVRELLPKRNYRLLKYLMAFLSRVLDAGRSDAKTLAHSFGTYIVWPEDRYLTTAEVHLIDSFVEFLFVHRRDIFKQ